MKIPTTVVTLMALAAGLLSAAPAATADPASEVTVVWPEVTRFNPTLVPYEATVTNVGSGDLYSSWGYEAPRTPVPESGDVALPPDVFGSGHLFIWSCVTDQSSYTTCRIAATSPTLQVYSRIRMLDPYAHPSVVAAAGPNKAEVSYLPQPTPGDIASASWELLDTSKAPFADPIAGTVSPDVDLVGVGRDRLTTVPFTVPAELPSGHYYLDVRINLDTAAFGSIAGTLGELGDRYIDVYVDNDPPKLKVGQVAPTVYPVRDRYLDRVSIRTTVDDDEVNAWLEAFDSRGERVYRSRTLHPGPEVWDANLVSWNGRTARGEAVPEGSYTLRLTAEDQAGNTDVWTGTIAVSHKSLRWKDFKRTVTAAASRLGKPFVGRCSTLSSPAHGGPHGSLGFYSHAKCRGDARASTVATNHGMYLPKAFDSQYAWAVVTLNGGPASRSSRNYIVLGYLAPPRGRLLSTRTFRQGNGAHPGGRLYLQARDAGVWDRKTDKPYIVWSNGLTAGSRYDVRSYTVKVRYRVLR